MPPISFAATVDISYKLIESVGEKKPNQIASESMSL